MKTQETMTARGFKELALNPRSNEANLRSALKAAAERVSEAVLHTRATRIELERALEEQGKTPVEAREAAERRVSARIGHLRGEE